MMRLRAIACAVWYGALPWQVYERKCHYAGKTYLQHLWLNLGYAFKWATWRETDADVRFEQTVNGQTAPQEKGKALSGKSQLTEPLKNRR